MPTPTNPVLISVKNANLSTGDYIKVTNYTSGNSITGQCNSSGECVLNPSDFGYTWNNGDSIIIESNGRIIFSKSGTIKNGGFKITNSTSTAYDGPAVSL